jgi:hypothetical protein
MPMVAGRRHAALQLRQGVKAAPFPQLGFTYCWETCPFGINGRSWYARVDVAL